MSEEKILYVDASNQILGRMASIVAKKLLEGYKVIIVNSEKAVLSGERGRVIEGYKNILKAKTHYNPEKSGIKRPRSPVMIMKRAVKRMLPYTQPKGREALRRLRIFVGTPESLKGKEFVRFKEADASRLKKGFVYVGEVATALGWKGGLNE
uniref:Large ribosomal subunit protein uL13 n=1 Tax=Thermosphaera aggregans TaxID=54254 RepID=A0A7C2BKM7_9CREN